MIDEHPNRIVFHNNDKLHTITFPTGCLWEIAKKNHSLFLCASGFVSIVHVVQCHNGFGSVASHRFLFVRRWTGKKNRQQNTVERRREKIATVLLSISAFTHTRSFCLLSVFSSIIYFVHHMEWTKFIYVHISFCAFETMYTIAIINIELRGILSFLSVSLLLSPLWAMSKNKSYCYFCHFLVHLAGFSLPPHMQDSIRRQHGRIRDFITNFIRDITSA